jgi:hypothetical protein
MVPNIDNLISNIEKIQVNDTIVNKYLSGESLFETKNVNKYNMSQDEQRLQQKIQKWKGYQKNLDFINLLKIFDKTKNESTNSLLQKTIDDFVSGYSKKHFELLLNPSNSKSKNVIELIETGVTVKKNNPVKNTINVRMDLIIGEVDDSNKNSINCLYNKDYLGNELNILLNAKDKFWELDKNRFLFDMNKGKTIENNSKNEIEIENKIENKNVEKKPINTELNDDSSYKNANYGGKKIKNVTRKKRN